MKALTFIVLFFLNFTPIVTYGQVTKTVSGSTYKEDQEFTVAANSNNAFLTPTATFPTGTTLTSVTIQGTTLNSFPTTYTFKSASVVTPKNPSGDIGTITINSDGSYAYAPFVASNIIPASTWPYDNGNSNFYGPLPTISYNASNGVNNNSLTISLTPINDGVTNKIPSYNTAEDAPLTLNTILANGIPKLFVYDPDADDLGAIAPNFTASIRITSNSTTYTGPLGTLTAPTGHNLTIVSRVDNDGLADGKPDTIAVTFYGKLSDINAYLADQSGTPLTWTPPADINTSCIPSFSISLSTMDNRNYGANIGGTGTINNRDVTKTNIAVSSLGDITNDNIEAISGVATPFNVITGTNGATADNFETPVSAINVTRINGDTLITDGTVYTDANGNTLAANKDGSLTFTSAPGFTGATTFTYTAKPGTGCAETATITINVTQAMPVTFGGIKATINGNNLLVNWSTLKETHNDHFEVEVSGDGVNFTNIGAVASKAKDGNSDLRLEYSFGKSLSEANELFGISLTAISLLFLVFNRKNKFLYGLVLIAGIGIIGISCNKSTDVVNRDGRKIFVRIAQIDEDGTKKYSDIVQAVKE